MVWGAMGVGAMGDGVGAMGPGAMGVGAMGDGVGAARVGARCGGGGADRDGPGGWWRVMIR